MRILIPIIIVLVLVIIITTSLGLTKSKDEKELEKEILEKQKDLILAEQEIIKHPYLDVKYWKSAPYGSSLIPDVEALEYAKRLKKALNSWNIFNPYTWNDDIDEIFIVFNAIPNKWAVSQVANKYEELAGQNLGIKIGEDIRNSNILKIIQILNKK